MQSIYTDKRLWCLLLVGLSTFCALHFAPALVLTPFMIFPVLCGLALVVAVIVDPHHHGGSTW